MHLMVVALLLQVLTAPDPAQMENAPDLGYKPVPHGLQIPSDVEMGAPSSVAWTSTWQPVSHWVRTSSQGVSAGNRPSGARPHQR